MDFERQTQGEEAVGLPSRFATHECRAVHFVTLAQMLLEMLSESTGALIDVCRSRLSEEQAASSWAAPHRRLRSDGAARARAHEVPTRLRNMESLLSSLSKGFARVPTGSSVRAAFWPSPTADRSRASARGRARRKAARARRKGG
eukprot:443166-Pleurochrysis_carterae.AAC.1